MPEPDTSSRPETNANTDAGAEATRRPAPRHRRAEAVAFALALAAGVGGAASGVAYSRGLAELGRHTQRTQSAVHHAWAVLSAAQDIVIGTRGYAITGSDTLLAPMRAAVQALPALLDSLRDLTAGDARGDDIERLEALIRERVLYSDSIVALRRRAGSAAATAHLTAGDGTQTMDAIRTQVRALIDAESRALARRQADLRRRTANMLTAVLLTSAAAAALLIGIFVALRQEVRSRRRAERELTQINDNLEKLVAERTAQALDTARRLRATLDSMMEGAQVIGFDFRYRYLNRVALEHARKPESDLLGRTMMECYPGIEATEAFQAIAACMRDRTSRAMENEFTYPDGARAWFDLRIQPTDEGVFILSVDITERKAREVALAQAEERRRALLAGLQDDVILLDDSLRVLDMHAPRPDLLAMPRDTIIGERLADAMPDAAVAAIAAAADRARSSGAPASLEYHADVSGRRRTVEGTAVAMSGGRTTVVLRDVTDRRNIEAQLRQAQKMEAVGQVTSGMAHDFNNILTVIGSNAELLTAAVPPGSPAAADLADLRAATERGAQMIAQLLRFSRKGTVTRRPINLVDTIRNLAPMVSRLLPQTVRLETTFATDSLLALADPGSLEQVVLNLCTNARDAMPNGGTLTIACERTRLDTGFHAGYPWVRPGAYACIAVSDTGVGMDEQTRSRIFEPFFTTKAAGVGTGLGMAMVYALVREHDGMVNVYSEPGHGTTVRLYLPLDASAVAPDDSGRSAERTSAPARGGTETLLLVDDDAAIRRASRRALEQLGYSILEAGDGEAALAVFETNRDRIGLVVSDLVMPKLGGRQLADALRARGVTVPILLMSGQAGHGLSEAGDIAGNVAFLNKPWTLSDLQAAIRGLLDGRPQ